MTYKHIVCILVFGFLPLLSGCSHFGWKGIADNSPDSSINLQKRRLATAIELLRTNQELVARDLLEKLVAGPTVNGITDEALFRLSLLSLRENGTKGTVRVLELLERLKNEFPRSLWTHQSASLVVYLTNVKTLLDKQRNVKTLKEHNLSLSRDNREMRQSIERLKALDLELEQKIKR